MGEDVLIVGAGLAGLACALRLQERGIRARIYEASDRVGGRVATDQLDGFLLDRGFQVLLTAYPFASQLLDYARLGLAHFHAGAKVQIGGKFHTLGDPSRHPADALPTLLAPVGTLADKARILRLRARVTSTPLDAMLARKENTTRHRLINSGFSAAMIEQFFRPFLGGIFLEKELVTSSRKFEFVFRMFSQGTAALPKSGMGAIPHQLAERLGFQHITFNREVTSVERGAIILSGGERIDAKTVVVATDSWNAQRLLGLPETSESNTIACLYFAAGEPPAKGPWLLLNGENAGPVNNLCVLSQVDPSYAPYGQSLISATVIDTRAALDAALETNVRTQLSRWFGLQVASWRHLRTYRIARPIPPQVPPSFTNLEKPAKVADRIFVCGDAGWIASIEGALRSGWKAGNQLSL